MRYREFGVSNIESDRNRNLDRAEFSWPCLIFGFSSPACQVKAEYEYSVLWLEARRTKFREARRLSVEARRTKVRYRYRNDIAVVLANSTLEYATEVTAKIGGNSPLQ
eukprot:COSAG01_NODE_1309_length_10793_cov_10.360483_6_plen_108_part_00